jgi:diadenosine tetraphosphate (Ap4A) HIT family hydrolase
MDDHGVTFWKEVMAVAAALHEMVHPLKMNYEIHGNTLPHLHMHLFPRQRDDGFVGRPINLKEVRHCYSDDDLVRLQSVLSSLSI